MLKNNYHLHYSKTHSIKTYLTEFNKERFLLKILQLNTKKIVAYATIRH